MCKRIWMLIVFLAGLGVFAQQTTDYLIVDAPIGCQAASKVLWVKWAGTSRGITSLAPDSGTIYFDRSPGGGKLANYRYKITTPYADTSFSPHDSIQNNIYFSPAVTGSVPQRGTAFRAADQKDMGFGVFYCLVALPLEGDTLVSNEFQMIIESTNPVDWSGPSGEITSITPTFQWKANSGVPYYHIILSDDVIKIDSSSGDVNLEGLSIIWQAITPATQMTYGAPDPSNTITADPPPLSPGQQYTWLVLNNYGNHPAFSSTKIKLPPGEFKITGESLKKPICLFPKDTTLTSVKDKTVKFTWANTDPEANTYKIYIYVGSEFEGINAQLVVYQTEVVASGKDTLSVAIDAASVLTSNKYVWRAIAVSDAGAGTTGDTVGFNYTAPVGSIRIYTKEKIIVGSGVDLDTVTKSVGLVELKVDVLDGSLEAPLLFYTDNNGYIDRDRPVGTYRVTAKKNEFEDITKTIIVKDGQETVDTFYLDRPEATVYGKVLDEAGKGINLARVYGVSDRGDTVRIDADALGNFVLNCYASDWRIGADMTGYKSVLPIKKSIVSAENLNFGNIRMEKNPFTLSGIVKNGTNSLLLGVRVRIYKDGTLLSEIPSTPQTGIFSFTLPAGTYVVKAEKTGFTSYEKSIDVSSSKSVSVTLEAGATLVTGYIYGKTWVGEREVIAPITNARIVFIRDLSTDTMTVISNVTYGDFKVSLTGDKKYSMYCSASGFAEKKTAKTFTTELKTTQSMVDTLQGLGMMSGTVTLSATKAALGTVSISLVTVTSGQVVSSGKTSANGYFELRNIPDGHFLFRAGKDGIVLDSIGGKDTVIISAGKAGRTSAKVYMKAGDKTITWKTISVPGFSGSVKIVSPLVKTMATTDSLKKAGPGLYVMAIDAAADSLIDLSYHSLTVLDTEVVHDDTIYMGLIHKAADTLTPVKGKIILSLRAYKELDSVELYVKDAIATTYTVLSSVEKDTAYTFSFIPPRDGSTMLYYFKAWRGSDVFGYDKEVKHVYITPDRSMLTRFEILPSGEDTLTFPASYEAQFSFRGYVSSAFLLDATIDASSIIWSLDNAQGCTLDKKTGRTTTVTTSSSLTGPVRLTATIDTTKTPLAPGIKLSVSRVFDVSGTSIKAIEVIRIDANNPDPISTSSADRAIFTARGVDTQGKMLDISPVWSISPSIAGTIGTDGLFRPARQYAGFVQILANASGVNGEYFPDNQSQPGLNVRYMIVNKSTPDTASNGPSCRVVFPPHVVEQSEVGLLEIGNTNLKNQIKRGVGNIRTIDTLAYEINQLENIVFDLSADSIRLILKVPESMQKKVADGSQKIAIAQWLEDSLMWKPLENSRINTDGSLVSASLSHFSIYTLVSEPTENISLLIAPNPFSPFIRPPYHPIDTDIRVPQQYGTCIRIVTDTKEIPEVKLRIYNILGDMVWSYVLHTGDPVTDVWWNGRSSSQMLQAGQNGAQGGKMCRNGRYFVTLTTKVDGKEKRIMKQIILMK